MPRTFFKVYGVRDPAQEAKRLECFSLPPPSVMVAACERLMQRLRDGEISMDALRALCTQEMVRRQPMIAPFFTPEAEQMRLRWPTASEVAESFRRIPVYEAPTFIGAFFGSKERFVWPADIEVVAARDWHAPEMKNPATFGSFSVSTRFLGPMEFKD